MAPWMVLLALGAVAVLLLLVFVGLGGIAVDLFLVFAFLIVVIAVVAGVFADR